VIALHPLFPAVTQAQVAAELLREEEQRRRFYPRRVEALEMTAADAEHQLAAAAAWREDCDRFTGRPLAPARHGLAWRVRRIALAREIALRRRHYPRWVEELKLTPATAEHRIACLEALASVYDDGLDWSGPGGSRCTHTAFAHTADDRAAAAAWATHRAEVDARRNPASQEEMTL
jgi:hypothetical protein|tara:strand:- start:2822 stop:3349 length:528 start_codon:yes stop_codon:yes gene_type:complete